MPHGDLLIQMLLVDLNQHPLSQALIPLPPVDLTQRQLTEPLPRPDRLNPLRRHLLSDVMLQQQMTNAIDHSTVVLWIDE